MRYRNGIAEMSINNIKKPDSLIRTVDKIAKLCPFNSNSADDGKKMDMDSSIAELKSAFREYADIIEREVIKLTRIYQAEYEEMWQKVIEENEVFNINLDSLMNKNRRLEDKLHGFIAKKADVIFEYSYNPFQYVLSRYTRHDYSNGYTESFYGNYKNGYECMKSEMMKYIDKYVNTGIFQMSTHISNVLHSHDSAIRKQCFKLNMLRDESIKEKKKLRNSLSGKCRYLKRKVENLKIRDDFENTLAVIVNDIMENEADESYTRIKKRVRRTRKRY